MQTKFRALRFIGLLLKIIGGIELAVGLISVLLLPLLLSDPNSILLQFGLVTTFPGSGFFIGIFSGLFIFLCGLVFGLLTFSAGEVFNVLIAVEENTRNTVLLLQKYEKGIK